MPRLTPPLALDDPTARTYDLWPAFDWSNSLTYATWIATIDAALPASVAATKTSLGASSNAARDLYRYTAGLGAYTVLLNGGIHGNEKIGMAAAFRWFAWFAAGQDRLAARLRRALRVIYVPTANPASFRSARKNGNGVDINRNFPFYWSLFSDTDPSSNFYKGASSASEPETVILQGLLEDEDVRAVLDLHDFDNAGDDSLSYVGPSPWCLGHRGIVEAAVQSWQAAYNADRALTVSDLLPNSGEPTWLNYANWYIREEKGISNAAVLTVECYGDLESSTSTLTTQAALSKYNGLVTHFLLHWLRDGQRPPATYIPVWKAYRDSEDAATSITAGGTLIDTSDATALTFSAVRPTTNGNTLQSYVRIVPICPGELIIEARGYVAGDSAAAGTDDGGRVNFSVTVNNASIGHGVTSVLVPDVVTDDDRVNFVIGARYTVDTVDAATVYDVRLICDREWAKTFYLKRYSMFVWFVPNTTVQPIPRCNP